jgi:hypothetical protein
MAKQKQAAQRRLGTVDVDTGEVLDGVAVFVGQRAPHSYGDRWMQMSQDALTVIARDQDLTLVDHRVFASLNARLDFENWLAVSQASVARELDLDPAQVSRSLSKLRRKRILLDGPKIGRSRTLRLNPQFGWKGSVRKLRQTQADLHGQAYQDEAEQRRSQLRPVEAKAEQAEETVTETELERLERLGQISMFPREREDQR